jgi:hypothetical protein
VLGGTGNYPVIALKSDGSLWQWMENEDRTISDPTPYLPESRWKSIARDRRFFVAISMDNSMWAWGMKYGMTASVLQNPIVQKISDEAAQLFPHDGAPNLQSEEIKALIENFGPEIERLGLDFTDVKNSSASSTYQTARYKEENAFETPFRVGTRNNWDSVRFSGRIVRGSDNNNTFLFNNILIGTESNGSIFAPSGNMPKQWRREGISPSSEPFTELNLDAVPTQMKYDQGLNGENLTLITSTGSLARYSVEQKREDRIPNVGPYRRIRLLDFSKKPTPLSDRNNWISFTQNNYSIVALSADGLLWHSGPWPMKGQPGKILPFLVPSSSKLRPVFDFKTGKAL